VGVEDMVPSRPPPVEVAVTSYYIEMGFREILYERMVRPGPYEVLL
jgi:hypothetical protein